MISMINKEWNTIETHFNWEDIEETIMCTILKNHARSCLFIEKKAVTAAVIWQRRELAKNQHNVGKFTLNDNIRSNKVIYFKYFQKIHGPCRITFSNTMEFDNAIRYNGNVHETKFYWDLNRQQREFFFYFFNDNLSWK